MAERPSYLLSGGETLEASRVVNTLAMGVRWIDGESGKHVATTDRTIIRLGNARAGTPEAELRDWIEEGVRNYIAKADPPRRSISTPATAVAVPSSKPIARSDWPLWAKVIAAFRIDTDAGIGDTAKRMLGNPGEKFKAMMVAAGAPCGCDDRREEWNVTYRYDPG